MSRMKNSITFEVTTGKRVAMRGNISEGTFLGPVPTIDMMEGLLLILKQNNFVLNYPTDPSSTPAEELDPMGKFMEDKILESYGSLIEAGMIEHMRSTMKFPKVKNGHRKSSKAAVDSSVPFGGREINYCFSRGSYVSDHPKDIVIQISSSSPFKNVMGELMKTFPGNTDKPMTVIEAMIIDVIAKIKTQVTRGTTKEFAFPGSTDPVVINSVVGKNNMNGGQKKSYPFPMVNGKTGNVPNVPTVKEEYQTMLRRKGIIESLAGKEQDGGKMYVSTVVNGKVVSTTGAAVSMEDMKSMIGIGSASIPSPYTPKSILQSSQPQLMKQSATDSDHDRFKMPDPDKMSPVRKKEKCNPSKCTNIFCPGNSGYQPVGPVHGGELPDDDNFFSSYIEEELSHVSSEKSFGSRVSSVRNHKELLNLVLGSESAMAEIQMFTSYVINSLENTPPAKDVSLAQSLRNEGNDFYNRKMYMEALIKYNEAIIRSPGPDVDCTKELAKCFNNRSLLYYSINRFQECIYDINEAIRCGYTTSGCKNSLITLLKRKVRCYRQLHDTKSIEVLMKKAIGVISNVEEISDLKASITSALELVPVTVIGKSSQVNLIQSRKYQIKNKHKLMKEVSDAVEMTNEGRRGLRLRAARRISANEVLVNETTLGSVLLRRYSKERCFYCLKLILCSRIIPCFKCNYSVYCSRKCQRMDWIKSHYIECDLLPILKYFPVGQSIIKLLLTYGIDEVVKTKSMKYEEIPFKKYGNDLRSFFSRDIILPDKNGSRINFTMTSILLTNLLTTFYNKYHGAVKDNCHSCSNAGDNQNVENVNFNNNNLFNSQLNEMSTIAKEHGFDVECAGTITGNGLKFHFSKGDKNQSNGSTVTDDHKLSSIDLLFAGGKKLTTSSSMVKNGKHGPMKSSTLKLNQTILKMILIMYDTRDVMIGSSASNYSHGINGSNNSNGYGSIADGHNGQSSDSMNSGPAFYGISVSPIIGLMPICCNANTDVINMGRKTIVSALRVIEKGEEIRVR